MIALGIGALTVVSATLTAILTLATALAHESLLDQGGVPVRITEHKMVDSTR